MIKNLINFTKYAKLTPMKQVPIKNFNKFYNLSAFRFCQEPKQDHKQAFENLKGKIDKDGNSEFMNNPQYNVLKDKLNQKKDELKENINNLKQKMEKKEESTEKNSEVKEEEKTQEQQEVKEGEQQGEQEVNEKDQENSEETVEVKKETYFEQLQKKDNYAGKFLKFSVDAFKETFPDEQYLAKQRIEEAKEQARKLRELQENQIEYTEEELEEIQQSIPEFKRTALQNTDVKEQKVGLKDKLKSNVKSKFNQTQFAKELYASEEYKNYEEVKSELKQFKEDAKDHLHNSPSNLVQGSLFVADKIKSESPTAKAITQMQAINPKFNINDLEQESVHIFETAFNLYLQGKIDEIERFCGEQALGYFKALQVVNKTKQQKPKFDKLWLCEKALFQKAVYPESILPVFQFHINIQEIHCFESIINGDIIDGGEDQIMSYVYQFGLRMHDEPDVERVGHIWELVELQPQQRQMLLV